MPDQSVPAPGAEDPAPLLQVEGLKKHFPLRAGLFSRTRRLVYAVDGVSFSIAPGETLGLVGESGCGKSTTGKAILRLIEPTAGTVKLRSTEITGLPRAELRRHRQDMQIVFQDPSASLNPRMTIGDIVAEPLENYALAQGREKRRRVQDLLHRVGLRPDHMDKYAHQLSGGQCQRVGIARAIALNPGLIVCDEAVSALDVSVQAQVINLLGDLQEQFGLSYLFISHDLAVVGHISHRIAVMYLGKIVELADRRDLFVAPQHPYTQALLSAVPIPDPSAKPERSLLTGDVPDPAEPPKGCSFNTRCPYAQGACFSEEPKLKRVAPGHDVACHLR